MTDYIVVGGGIHGCAVAWHMARSGASVALFEASSVAAGASGGVGERGVRANGRDVRELPLMRRAHRIWPELADHLGGPTGFRRIGHLLLAEKQDDLRRLDVQCALQVAHGIPSQVLRRGDVRIEEPATHDRVRRALSCDPDGVADHSATTLTWAKAATTAGVDLRENVPVESLWKEGGTVRGIHTSEGEAISAKRGVLLLANASVAGLLEEAFGIMLPVWPVAQQVVITEPMEHPLLRHLIGHAHRRLAAKPLPDGRMMLSGGWRGRWDEHRGVGEVVGAAVDGNWKEAVAVFPGWAELAIESAASDRPETMCIDGVPIVDKLGGGVPVWFGTGWTGHGWAIAPAVAEALAAWVLTGDKPGVLAPFGLSRFGSV